MTGELEFDNSFSETVVTLEGSVQLIFIGFFVTANIVIINVLISIAITVLKDGRVIKEELAAMARTLAVLELEQGLKWMRVSCSSYACCVICVNEMLSFQLMKRYQIHERWATGHILGIRLELASASLLVLLNFFLKSKALANLGLCMKCVKVTASMC